MCYQKMPADHDQSMAADQPKYAKNFTQDNLCGFYRAS